MTIVSVSEKILYVNFLNEGMNDKVQQPRSDTEALAIGYLNNLIETILAL